MRPSRVALQYLRLRSSEQFAKGYTPLLGPKQTQVALHSAKQTFEHALERELNLFKHVSAMCFRAGSAVNDDLDGSEHHSAVKFHVPNYMTQRGIAVEEGSAALESTHGFDAEVCLSLAKWKRFLLLRCGCERGEGLYCDSTSIRKGYFGDATHSQICDQWDWEMRIEEQDRTIDFLQATVRKVYSCIKEAEKEVSTTFPVLQPTLPEEIKFISSNELHQMFPGMDIHDRETEGVRKFGAMFVLGMGWPLDDGSPPQEHRAPDYDDWKLNGDIMVLHPVTKHRHELSSMGIRVDAASLQAQLEAAGKGNLATYPYHKAVLEGRLPLSIGGGVGISRLMMLLLQKGHIGEVQAGVWHEEHLEEARAHHFDIIPTDIPL